MKVLVADADSGHAVGGLSDVQWCKPNEILIFGLFQQDSQYGGNVRTMRGVLTNQPTSQIVVRELNIDREFYAELIATGLEANVGTTVDPSGDFSIEIPVTGDEQYEYRYVFTFSLPLLVSELLCLAEGFEDGERVVCCGRQLQSVGEPMLMA